MLSAERMLVLADLHLTRRTPVAVGTDLAGLLAAHPGTLVVLAGDLFDLAIEPDARGRDHAIAAVLEAQRGATAALARHLEVGGGLCLLAGNHDIDLAEPPLQAVIGRALGVVPSAGRSAVAERSRGSSPPHGSALTIRPWFVRLGSVHVEHGHVYDPDNAPEHPLVVGSPSLGAHFGREFLVPTGAHDFLHGNDSTPARLLLRAFTRYGWRGPYVVARYFVAALGALARSGRGYRASGESAAGKAREAAFIADSGLDRSACERLFAMAASPTLRSARATFARTYLDRSLPSAAVVAGALIAVLGRRRVGTAIAGVGSAALVASWLAGHDRYGGSVNERLRDAARRVADCSGAAQVVFGHTHRPELQERYANAGSFCFPDPGQRGARPFLDVDLRGGAARVALRWWPPTS